MSNDADGSGRSDNIDVIRQLLRKLEEVAAKDSERPADVVSQAEPADASQGLAKLQRSNALVRPAAQPLPEIAIVPFERPPDDVPAVLAPRDRRGIRKPVVVAFGSFVLGLGTALALIVAFNPFQVRRQVPTATVAAPTEVAAATTQASGVGDAAVQEQVASVAAATAPASSPSAATAPVGPVTPAAPVTEPASSAAVAAPSGPAVEPPVQREQPASPQVMAAPARAGGSIEPTTGQLAQERLPEAVAVPRASGAEPVAPSPALPTSYALTVPARFALRPGAREAFELKIDPMPMERASLLLVLRQVPEWLTFSKGSVIGNAIWLLPAHEAVGLEAVVQSTASGSEVMTVELATIDGRILASAEFRIAVVRDGLRQQGQPAMPLPLATTPLMNDQAMLRLLAHGELLLDTGEIEAARTLLRTAAEAGSVGAALKLAETYDPAQVQRLGMMDTAADPVQAVLWYERAQALGSVIATARLLALGRR